MVWHTLPPLSRAIPVKSNNKFVTVIIRTECEAPQQSIGLALLYLSTLMVLLVETSSGDKQGARLSGVLYNYLWKGVRT